MHVAHTLYGVANVFERTRCAIHFQVFENVVECDGYALVEFCRLLERFEIEGRVGDENLLDGFDVLSCLYAFRSIAPTSEKDMPFAFRPLKLCRLRARDWC